MTHFTINKKNSGNFCTYNICRKNSVLVLAVILTKSNWIGFKLNFFKGFKSKFQISFSFRWWHFFYWWQIRFAYSNINKANENQHILGKNKTQNLPSILNQKKKDFALYSAHLGWKYKKFFLLYLFNFRLYIMCPLWFLLEKKFQ